MNETTKLMLSSVVRSVFLSLGGYFVAKGWTTNDVVQQVVPALVIAITALWGALEKKNLTAK